MNTCSSRKQYVETLSDAERKKYRIYAYACSWFGCFSEILQDSSAVLILYFVALGGSNMMVMLTTSFSAFTHMFLLIPLAGLVARIGPKKVTRISSWMAFTSLLMMSLAPWLGSFGRTWAFLWCFAFTLARPFWSAAWYPILSDILLPRERGAFFGFLRFSYYVMIGGSFFLLGLFMGKDPPILLLQIVIAVCAVLTIGRTLCVDRICLSKPEPDGYSFKKAFAISVRNGPLVTFSVYLCCLFFAFTSVTPLALLYLKSGLHFGDNIVQIVSTVGMAGSICGFFFYNPLLKAVGMRVMQIATHILYILIPLGFFFCGEHTPGLIWIMGSLLFAASFAAAAFVCSASSEQLALARPGNSAMATAFSLLYQTFGTGAGRILTALLIGGNALAANWSLNGVSISRFQTIFLGFSFASAFFLVLLFCLPSVVPKHNDYYNPGA